MATIPEKGGKGPLNPKFFPKGSITQREAQVRTVEAWLDMKAKLRDRPSHFFNLPGGWDVTWDQLNQGNAQLMKAYGWDELINNVNPMTTPTYVLHGEAAEGRAFGRYKISREAMLASDDPGLIALTQATFQHRPERAEGRLDARMQDIMPLSGTRMRWDTAERLMRQKNAGFANVGSRVVFDLETASLMPEHGIRQLSARFYDAQGNEIHHINQHFDNPFSGMGHYGTDQLNNDITFGQYIGGADPDDIDSLGRKKYQVPGVRYADQPFGEAMEDFFLRAQGVKSLVGQNAAFDVGMLQGVMNTSLYNDPSPRGVRFKAAVDDFFAKAQTDNFYDTAAHARMLMGEIDIAPEFIGIGKGSTFSIENIFLQSTFLDDIVSTKIMKEDELNERLAKALHDADVDTLFTDLLFRLQGKIYEDPQLHSKLLRSGAPTRLTKQMRQDIVDSGAATAITALPQSQLTRLIDMGILNPDGTKKMGQGAITALDQMMLLSRNLDLEADAGVSPIDLQFKTGIWSRYVKERNILSPTGFGRIGDKTPNFPQLGEFLAKQQEFAKAGMPFSGLSMMERLLSGIMGASESAGSTVLGNRLNRQRRILGELAPVGMIHKSNLRLLGRGNVAMPMEILQGLSEAGLLETSQIADWADNKAPLLLGVSPFKSTLQDGKTEIRDVAFQVRNLFAGEANSTERTEQVRKIAAHLQAMSDDVDQDFTIAPSLLEKLQERLIGSADPNIQIGTLGGARGTPEGTLLYNVMDEMGQAVDRKVPFWVAPLMHDPEYLTAANEAIPELGAGFHSVGPLLSTAGGDIFDEKHGKSILREVGKLRDFTEYSWKEASNDSRLMTSLLMEQTFGGGVARKTYEAAGKVADFIKNPITLGAAAGAGIGYYLFNRHRKQEPYQDTFAGQGIESDDAYSRYKQDLGESPLPKLPLIERRGGDPLASAGTVGRLDQNKIGHTRMGPDKDSHLFSGAY